MTVGTPTRRCGGARGVLADLAVGFYNATPLCVALLIILFP